MSKLSWRVMPLAVAIACLGKPTPIEAQEGPPKTIERAMEKYVLEQLGKDEVAAALVSAAHDASKTKAEIERGVRAVLQGVDAANELLSGGFDVVLGGSAIAMTGGVGAVAAAADVIMGAFTESPEALMERRLATLEKTVANLQSRIANTEAMLEILAKANVENSRDLLNNTMGQDQRELERLSGRVAHLRMDSDDVRKDTINALRIHANTFLPEKFSDFGYRDSEQRWQYPGIRVRYNPSSDRPLQLTPEKVKTTISLERYVLVLALVVKAERLTGTKVLSTEERRDHTEFLTVRASRSGDTTRLAGGERPNDNYPMSLQEQMKPAQCRLSVDKYSAVANPAKNIPKGLCQGELVCWRYTTVRKEFWFVKPDARALCTHTPAQAPDSERVAYDLLLDETRDPQASPAAAQLMMAAAAYLNGQSWPPRRGAGNSTPGTFDFSTRNLVGAELLAISTTGELAQFAFLDYEKKVECGRRGSVAAAGVQCQPVLVTTTGPRPASAVPPWRKVTDIKEVARLSSGWGGITGAGSIYVNYSGANSSHSIVATRNDGVTVWRTVDLQSSTSTACSPRAAGVAGAGGRTSGRATGNRFRERVSDIQTRCLHTVTLENSSIAPRSPTLTMSEKPLGWGPYVRTFSGGQGIAYAIDSKGDLYWLKDTKAYEAPGVNNKITKSSAPIDCLPTPGGGNVLRRSCATQLSNAIASVLYNRIGEGWSNMRAVTSSGRGVIYALGSDGVLRLYRHTLFSNDNKSYTATRWQPTKQMAAGWTGVKSMTADMNGSLYVLKESGELLYYKASDFPADPAKLAAPVPIGGDWSQYRYIFALNNQLERDRLVR